MLCEHISTIEQNLEKNMSLIYAPRRVIRCQTCIDDTVPEFNTWMSVNDLLDKKDKIYYCEDHIDHCDMTQIYLNLSDTCIWCRECEARYTVDTPLVKNILKTISIGKIPGTRGIKNLGNTCFINSVVQSLSNCTGFKYFFIELLNSPEDFEKIKGNKLLTEFAELIKKIWDIGSTIVPNSFIDAVYEEFSGYFIRGEQNDAHEFLINLINFLNESLCKLEISNKEIVNKNFSGELLTFLKCLQCNETCEKSENFYDLALPVVMPEFSSNYEGFLRNQERNANFFMRIKQLFTSNAPRVDMQECLQMYFDDVEVTELKNLRQCSTCDEKTSFRRGTRLSSLPNNLLLILKRYGNFTKSKLKVHFPIVLKMTNFTGFIIEGNYELYALIDHVGLSNIGHYRSYCKNHVDSKWYCYDDSTVSEVSIGKILKLQAYIGFYELIKPNN